MEWKNISTAPKDGTRIHLGYKHMQNFDVIAHFDVEENMWKISNSIGIYGRPSPTHWRPLPKAPKVDKIKITPRKVIQEFGEEQEKILKNNDHKRDWKSSNIEYLWSRLIEEIEELDEALISGTFEEIKHECVDVANFAMMIHDLHGKKIGSER